MPNIRQVWVSLAMLLIFAAGSAHAASPKEELQGIWVFKRGRGGPCEALIVKLKYSFRRNGSYESSSDVRTPSGVRTFRFTGTYSATDSFATAHVDGADVGPYPYRISGDTLIIRQPEFNCEVEMEREDY